MSNVALADADVIRPKKTIARNMSAILSDCVARRQIPVRFAEESPIWNENAISPNVNLYFNFWLGLVKFVVLRDADL
jgi:hypothetical protein